MQVRLRVSESLNHLVKLLILFLFDCFQTKKEHAENEAIHNEVVGQAHMEGYALKLFLYADNEDRAARFGK